MKDKSKLLTVLLVIVTIVVVIVNYIYNNSKKEEEKKDIKIVTNYSNFYTVNSCLYRVINYIYLGDKDSLIKLVSDEYKKDNNITTENILDLFPKIDNDSTFDSRKMYYEKINENIIKFYVYGHIKDNVFIDDDVVTKINYTDSYFIVYLDFENKIFSIEPYDGEIFMGGDNNEG